MPQILYGLAPTCSNSSVCLIPAVPHRPPQKQSTPEKVKEERERDEERVNKIIGRHRSQKDREVEWQISTLYFHIEEMAPRW